MRSPWSSRALVTSLLLVFISPLLARAECITLPAPKGSPVQRFNPLTGATLAFAGTATDRDGLAVSFNVEQVWKGELHRHTTLLIVAGEGDVSAKSFDAGVTYVVIAYDRVFGSDDDPLAPIAVQVNCGTPSVTRSSNAKALLKSLGRGKSPLP